MASFTPRRFLLPLIALFGCLAEPAVAGTWSIQPWTNDASMGLSTTDTLWAYHLGSATTATVSGVSIPGLAGPPPTSAAGKVEISGLQFVLNPDFNNLTSQTGTGSATIGSSFFYGGFPATITVKSGAGSLQPGLTYRVSLFSVGWDDAPGLRLIKFVSGSDELPADQAMYGENNGLRTDYEFIAGAGDQVINVQMNNGTNRTYHLYAVALTKVKYPTQVALTSSVNPSQPGQNVTFTATVTATGAPATPSGTVTFLNGGTPIGGPVALNGSGVAVLNTSALPVGTHNITATYNGAGDYPVSNSAPLSQVVAGIFTVTTSADSGPGSLRDTVAATPAGSAIQFSAAVEGKPILLTSGEIVLDKNVLIDAASYAAGAITILGNETNRLFYVAAGASVEFRNLTLSGGGGVGAANTDRGGAVLNAGSLICTDCRFTGNKGVFGGAIATGYSTGNATLILRRCWIFDNVATGGGGGVTQVALANGLTSQLTMEECTVEDNRAGGGGGGVYNQVINGTVNASLRQCTVRGNTAVSNAAGGGGIFSRSGGITSIASLTLTHCTVTDNSARYSGGVGTGTDNGGATNLTMTGCIIAGNHSPFAQDVGRQGGSFTSGGGNLIGTTGHSFVDDWAASDLTGTDAAPLDARLAASGFYGGPVPTCPPLPGSPALDAAAVPAMSTDQRGLPRIQDADGTGGAITDIGAVESIFAQVDVADDELDVPAGANDVSLREALRDAPAGAIITFAPGLSGQTMMLNDTLGSLTVTKNVGVDASGLQPGGFTLQRTGSNRLITVNAGISLGLNDLRIMGPGPGTLSGAGAAVSASGPLSLTACTVSGHSSSSAGGAILSSSAMLLMRKCTLSGNTALLSGGSCTAVSSLVRIAGCTFSGNESQNNGGGLNLNKSFGCLSQCTFSGNRGLTGGGAMSVNAALRLSFCTVTANTTEGVGGGISTLGSAVPVVLAHSILAGNSATTAGSDLPTTNSPVFIRGGPCLIGDNAGSSVFPPGTPNANGDYVGTTAAPVAALLGPLGNNGGPTQTHLPLAGSPAIDHATTVLSHFTDARGFPRNKDGDGDFTFVSDIGAVEAGTDPVLVVNTLADELDTPTAGPNLSLREALRAAPAGTVITFAPPLNGQTIVMDAAKGCFDVTRNVTVDASGLAAGLTLDAGVADNRHLFIGGGAHVVINRITLINGGGGAGTTEINPGTGGAIYVFSGTLALTDCTLRDNTATSQGGAIGCHFDDNRMVLQRCTLHRNQVTHTTGTPSGGALGMTGGLIELDHCTLTANHAKSYGGAVFFQDTQLEMRHCTITGNTVTPVTGFGGGLVAFNSPQDRMRISNSIFCANSDGLDAYMEGTFTSGGGNVGGGIFPTFDQPTDTNGTTPSQLNLAELGRYGGLTDTMPPLPSSPALDRATGSTATTDQRGVIRPIDGNFDNNAVADSGAAESFVVRLNGFSDELDTPAGTRVSLREAVRDAPVGAVLTAHPNGNNNYLSRGELVVNKSLILAGTSAQRIQVGHTDTRALHILPGVCFHASRVDFEGSPTYDNTGNPISYSAGLGAVESGKGGAILNQGTLSLADCVLRYHGASQGGAIANGMAATPSLLTLRRCTLANNQASTQGGAIYNSATGGGGAIVELENCLIYGNTSLRHGGAVVNTCASGTAITTATHCTVMNNKATSSGGGFYNNQVPGNAITILASSIVAGNTAPAGPDVQRAAGVMVSNGTNLIGVVEVGTVSGPGTDLTGTAASPLSPQINLEANVFAPLPGSPVLDAAAATTLVLDRNRLARTVDGNFTGGAQADIGAVEAPAVLVTTAADELDTPAGASVSLREALRDAANGAIIGINSTLDGQTLTLNSSLGQIALSNKSITLDASALAAGFTIDAAGNSRIFQFSGTSSLVRLRGLTLRGGKVTGDGGAILNSSRLTLENCWFTGNSATGSGGAVASGTSSGQFIIRGCSFTDNSATLQGGAVRMNNVYLEQEVTQCTFSGNRSGSRGGGIATEFAIVKVSQSTFTGNESNLRGGGLSFGNSSTIALDNCIIAGNRAPASPDLVVDNGTLTRTGANVIGVESATGVLFPAGLPTANGDYVGTAAAPVNALVAPVGLYGGRTPTCPPMAGSPALDRALGNTSATDQRGLTRSVDGDFNGSALPDIGAAESVVVLVDQANDELDTPAGVNDVSLREAVRDAPEGAVIGFAPNLSGLTLALGAGGVLIPPRAMIISASGLAAPVTLTPQTGNRLFFLPAQRTLGLSHLSLAGANVTGLFGAAIITDGSLSLSDCSLTANKSTIDGGAVAFQGTSLAINRCVFSGNQASHGGAIVVLSFSPQHFRRLSVQDSVFQTNSCSGRGGAISHYSAGDTCQTTVRRSTFTGNQAIEGGAVHHWANANGARSEVTLESCTLSANQASGIGAGVFSYSTNQGSCTTTLNQCTLQQNSAPSSSSLICLANGTTGTSGQVQLNRCTLAANTSTVNGAAVAAFGVSGAASSITVDGCVIAANTNAGGNPEVTSGGSGTVTSLGNNLIGKADGGGVTWQETDLTGTIAAPLDPMLASLGDYGGPTQTMLPLPGSPARDPASGATTAFNLVDQRGQPRLAGAKVDIGAVEAGAADAPGTIAFGGPVVRVNEGANPAMIPVYRTAGNIGTVTVNYQTFIAGSAAGFAAANDFSMTSGTVTFLPGQTVANIPIIIASDPTVKEPHENFNLILSNPGGGGILGMQNSTVVRILDFVDASAPTLTLTTPAANAIFTTAQGPQIAVTGSAKDDKGVQAVQVQLNGGAFVDAALLPTVPGTSPTFSLPVTAVPGVNNLVVRSVDEKGKVSALTKRSFTYRVTTVATVNVPLVFDSVTNTDVVGGTVTLPASVDKTVPRTYYVGLPYKFSAKPKPGYAFLYWEISPFTGTGVTGYAYELPDLTVIMRPGLSLSARFYHLNSTYPASLIGAFNGLILPSTTQPAPAGTAPGNGNTGLFTATLTSTGALSGSLKIDGTSLPFTSTRGGARFGTGLTRTDTLKILRKGKPDLELAIGITSYVPGQISGSVTQKLNGATVAVSHFTADRAAYSSKSKVPATLVAGTSQRYNLTFPSVPGQAAASAYPPGTGVGSLILGSDGSAKFAGTLADNTGFTASAALSAIDQAPLFVSLYSNKGHIAGNVSVVPPSNPGYDTFGVNYLWNRPQQPKVQWYPNGWPGGINVDMVGAKYVVPLATANQSVIPGLGPVDTGNTVGNATLTLMDGLLGSVRNHPVNITTKDVVTPLPLKTTLFTLTLTKTTGEISGTFTHTDGKKPAFKGTTIQKPGDYQGTYGFFMSVPPNAASTNGQGGSVMLLPGALAAP